MSVIPTSSAVAPKSSPRGIKRSRSPEQLGDLPAAGGADEGMSSQSTRLTVWLGALGAQRADEPVKKTALGYRLIMLLWQQMNKNQENEVNLKNPEYPASRKARS